MGAVLNTTKHGAGHRLALCLPVRAGADESQSKERAMSPWNEFLVYMSVVIVWMLVVYGIAKLKGE